MSRTRITPQSDFDVDELAAWLEFHKFDIEDVYRIDVHGAILVNGEIVEPLRVTIHRYRSNAEGHKFVEPDGKTIATFEPVTITPKRPLPEWS